MLLNCSLFCRQSMSETSPKIFISSSLPIGFVPFLRLLGLEIPIAQFPQFGTIKMLCFQIDELALISSF